MEDWILLALAMLATGCVAGVLAGLFGIGGGIVIVPVLEAVLGFLGVDAAIRMHIAVATSLATIIPTSISSAKAHHRRGAVNLEVIKRWAMFVLAGALLGAWIASQVHSRVLAAVFATLALLVAAKLVFFPTSRNLTDGVPRAPWVIAIPTAIGCFSSMMGIGGGTFSVMTLTLFNEPIHRAVGTAALFGLVISLPGEPPRPRGNRTHDRARCTARRADRACLLGEEAQYPVRPVPRRGIHAAVLQGARCGLKIDRKGTISTATVFCSCFAT
jgi:uncharacterized membrane protein YfcA